MTDTDQLTSDGANAVEPPAPPRRGRSRWWWVPVVVVVGAIGGGVLARIDSHRSVAVVHESSTDTEPVAGKQSVPSGLIGGATGAAKAPTHLIDNRVFVVGDSVMQGAAPYLAGDLPGWSIIADTKVGRFLDEADKVIQKRRKDIADIAVLNLGNNYDGNQQEFADQVAVTLAELSGVEHVIWLNVAEFQPDRAEVNAVLTQAATTHPNLTIVDWNTWWAANRAFTGSDHLHLTDAGAKAYASLVTAAVQQVTADAGEAPAAGVAKPSLNTSGTIPGSKGSRTTTPAYSSGHSSVRHTATTAALHTTPTAAATLPPAPPTTAATSDTAPAPTTPKATTPKSSSPPTSAGTATT